MAGKLVVILLLSSLLFTGCQTMSGEKACCRAKGQWQSLFDGKTLDGWRASENKDTFSFRDGMIVVDGPRSHLFRMSGEHDAQRPQENRRPVCRAGCDGQRALYRR
jgi:hypothetical protein